ncbi:MAG: DUF2339 domain-containing protein [Verrucomicrobia bacterium]|nr:DUF2339 domain-containing protein [Verrucomicrobiota bacterium]
MSDAIAPLLVLLGLVLLVAPILSVILAIISHSRVADLQRKVREHEAELEALRSNLTHLLKSQPPAPEPKQPTAVAHAPAAVPPTPPPVVAAALPPPKPVQSHVVQKPVEAIKAREPEWKEKVAPSPVPSPKAATFSVPPKPAFDWEALLGVRGAAWLGAIAFVIAASLFLKYAFDNNLITPAMQVALIILSGVAMLAGSEFGLRKGYAVTANALCGAGVAVLYAGFFAAHGVYHLVPILPTFALMAMVTVVACLLAVRHDAMFIAVLGLLGGFATPIVLSTGEDRPIGLFSYILLLDVGLLWVAVRKQWNAIVLLSLAATFAIEIGWLHKFMTPDKMLLGTGIFALFGLLYLALPLAAKKADEKTTLRAAILGGLAPFLFAFYMAGQRAYAVEWPLLFGLIACLDVAMLVITLARGQVWLAVSGAIATALTLFVWSTQALAHTNVWGASLSAIALCALFNLLPRAARRFAPGVVAGAREILEATGLIAGGGLALFACVLVANRLGEPPWVFLCLLAALAAVVFERSGKDALPHVAPVGGVALGLIVQFWFFRNTAGETLLRNLSLPVLLALGWSLASALRQAKERDEPTVRANEHEAGAVAATLIAVAGLFGCLDTSELGGDPWPLFLAMAFLVVLLVGSALRCDWSWLVAVALGVSAGFATAWHFNYFHDSDVAVVMPIYAAFYLAFLALPFAMPKSLVPTWPQRLWPWLASGLSGPLFFLVLYRAFVAACGKSYVGALPVAMAGLSVAALAHVMKRFAADGEQDASGPRLRNIALFGAVALGFVSVAIPLQLDKHWITLGWALEAAAVWWLYRRVPHPGLKYFGAALFAVVAARLLLNPEVLRYEERGWPILNWILYTYGVAAACCLAGARLLQPVEVERMSDNERAFFYGGKLGFAPVAGFLGLLLVFALINLEIADYYSVGRYLEFHWSRRYDRDLTTSVAWGLYALALLVIGMWRRIKPLRFISLGFMLLTIGKVFLYDLSSLTGLHRILSFLGLAVALIAVSLLYQRFVFRKEPES